LSIAMRNFLNSTARCWIVECTDRAVTTLIANDRKLRTLCTPLGDRHLAIRPHQETAFRKALLKLGCVLPRER
jgi:hypothetical protein